MYKRKMGLSTCLCEVFRFARAGALHGWFKIVAKPLSPVKKIRDAMINIKLVIRERCGILAPLIRGTLSILKEQVAGKARATGGGQR